MRYLIFTGLLLCFFYLPVNGQSDNVPKDGPRFYFNSFQDYVGHDADSALFFIKKLASNPNDFYMVEDLLHNTFAQTFLRGFENMADDSARKLEAEKRCKIGYSILTGMMADSNQNLVNAAGPIFYYTMVQQNENNDAKLIEPVNEFTTSQLSTNDLYKNRIGRYALLIHQIISKRKGPERASDQLLKTVMNKLKNNQVNVNIDSASRPVLERRTWYRYLYAYTNFIQGNEALQKKENKKAGEYLKVAFDYSPDESDNNNTSAYYYDMCFLLKKNNKRTFRDDYLNYLTTYSTDKQETLSALLIMAFVNTSYRENLKSFYNTHFSNQEKFSEYWKKYFNKNVKNAPDISLKKIDGSLFSSAAYKGKWILVDFWGTWCGPCKREHPDIENFYQTIKKLYADKITLLTIACRDEEERVKNYITRLNYTFPVALSDGKIEHRYNVKAYPSKFLISPQGQYLTIPFGVNWVDLIKKYADL